MRTLDLKVTVVNLGLVGDSDWQRFNAKQNRLAEVRSALESTRFRRSDPAYAALRSQLNVGSGRRDFIDPAS